MHYDLTTTQSVALGAVVLWEFIWKGIALWKAAQNRHVGWYLALLVLNTVGLLPIVYIFIYNNKKSIKEQVD